MPFDPAIPKTPAERFLIGIDFELMLPVGRSLASGTVAAYDEQGVAAPSILVPPATVTIAGTQAMAPVQNGVVGRNYRIIFSMLLDDGETIQDGLLLALGGLTGPS